MEYLEMTGNRGVCESVVQEWIYGLIETVTCKVVFQETIYSDVADCCDGLPPGGLFSDV